MLFKLGNFTDQLYSPSAFAIVERSDVHPGDLVRRFPRSELCLVDTHTSLHRAGRCPTVLCTVLYLRSLHVGQTFGRTYLTRA